MTKVKRTLTRALSLLTLAICISCSSNSSTKTKVPPESAGATTTEVGLVFDNVTLDQADEKGRRAWTVKSKRASYSQDKKTARVEYPTGDIYQDGKLVVRVSATEGEVQQDGQKIFLKGQIVATEIRNGLVLRGEELEWHPKEDLLIVRNHLTANHPQLVASAKEAKYSTRTQQVQLFGEIVATSKDPTLQLKTEHLIWQINQDQVIGDQQIHIDRYNGETVTDQVVASQSEVHLKTKVVTLKQDVNVTSIDPAIQITGTQATWNLNTRTVVSNQPIKIWDSKEQATFTANQGDVDLQQKVAVLTGDAQGVASQNQTKLKADRVIWEFPTQKIEALGNVSYQRINPPLNLKGAKAVGKLQDQSVVVTGSNGSGVVTEIVP